MFDTKIAIMVLEDLETWQKLNIAAFLASGIAAGAPQAMGEPYRDAQGREYAALIGQPIMILSATREVLLRARNQALQRDLLRAAYVRAMFQTGHDAANREVFEAEDADLPDLVGLAVRGPRKDIDKATKGARLHG